MERNEQGTNSLTEIWFWIQKLFYNTVIKGK